MRANEQGHGENINPQQIFNAQVLRGIPHSDLAELLYIGEDHLERFINGFEDIPDEIEHRLLKVLNVEKEFLYQWPKCPKCKCVVEEPKIDLAGSSLDIHDAMKHYQSRFSDYRYDPF